MTRRRRLTLTCAALAGAALLPALAAAEPDDADRARQTATSADAELRAADLRLGEAITAQARNPRGRAVTVARARGNLATFLRLEGSTVRSIDAALAGSNIAAAQRAPLAGARVLAVAAARRVVVVLNRTGAPQYGASRPSLARLRAGFVQLRLARRQWFAARGQLAAAVRTVVLRTFVLSVPSQPFPFLPGALPQARGVARASDLGGVDRMDLTVSGLPANQRYTIFLTQNGLPPFGRTRYLADVSTGPAGDGHVRVDAKLIDAFALGNSRVNLDHIVLWFADRAGDNGLFAGANAVDPDQDGDPGVTTGFDADGSAGVAVLTSGPTPQLVR